MLVRAVLRNRSCSLTVRFDAPDAAALSSRPGIPLEGRSAGASRPSSAHPTRFTASPAGPSTNAAKFIEVPTGLLAFERDVFALARVRRNLGRGTLGCRASA